MNNIVKIDKPSLRMVTFYHDIEQNIDIEGKPEECRYVVKEFLKLEKKYKIPATYNVVGKIIQEQPDFIESIYNSGQEVAFHSYNHQHDWKSEYYAEEINLCRKISNLPCGYRSPRSQYNQNTLKSLWDNNFIWNAEGDNHEEPYFIYKGLVRLPIASDDWQLNTGAITVKELIEQFSSLLKKRSYTAFGFHDCTVSLTNEERLKAYEKILQIAIQNKALLVNFFQAADLYRRAALSEYYSKSAKKWNKGTKNLYRTKRFKELIREEAEKLKQPVIADLGSGGGILSSNLKDIAKEIYCIDNAPGMVKDVEINSCIKPILGEVTDTNLPDNSIDFIICARIIEYLPVPEYLADEIKRIGKRGAFYIVTFPALRENPPSNDGSSPDRIRHYFTLEEIQKWADQIGPGRHIGIQYKIQEPHDFETEKLYREIEENPPNDLSPTNWVYIGTINKKYIQKLYRKTIPVSAFNFRFTNQKFDALIIYFKNIIKMLLSRIHKV